MAWARLQIDRAHAMAGDGAKIMSLSILANQRKDADRGIPIRKQAPAEYAKLQLARLNLARRYFIGGRYGI
jgi:hypothetical protein